MVAKSAFFLRSFGEDEAADRTRLVVSICMLIRSVGEIRLAQQRSLDHQAAVLAVGKLDLAAGINMAHDEAWRLAQRYRLLGEDPWTSSTRRSVDQVPSSQAKRTV